jgi:hypothetical protein
MKPLAEYFSPFACHILSLKYKYSRNPMNQPHVHLVKETKFFTLQKNRIYSSRMLRSVNFETIISSSSNHIASRTRL